jgi:FG-GAP repeat protein
VVAAAATLTGVGISVAHDVAAIASGCAHVRNDFNGDGFADVAASEPGRTVAGAAQAGAVRVVFGSSTGLTTSGNQYFDETSVGLTAGAFDNFGSAVASGYFNDDCYADLAIGAPGANGDAGRVVILYGQSTGLSASGATTLDVSAADAGDVSGDRFGMSLAAGDFGHAIGQGTNGLAVGAPGDANGAGAIALFDSGSTGLVTSGSAWITQNSPGIPGGSEAGDGFGWSLAAADYNADQYTDLAVSLPFEDLGSVADAGSVVLLDGPIVGGVAHATQGWSEDTTGVVGGAETDDEWGLSLAAGDVNHDGKSDLIVGAPGETSGSIKHAGAITVLRGALAGLTATASQYFSENTSGVPGAAETNDWFGSSLAVGDFNGDGYADAAIGDPSEGLSAGSLAGALVIINGSQNGLTATGSTSWSQDSSGIPGGVEARDMFGFALSALSVTKDACVDLVVGAAGESSSTFTSNGALTLIKGVPATSTTKAGLTGTGSQAMDAAGLANGAQSGPTGVGFSAALS